MNEPLPKTVNYKRKENIWMDLYNFNYISTRRNHVSAPLQSLIPCLLFPLLSSLSSPLYSPFSSSSLYSLSYYSSSSQTIPKLLLSFPSQHLWKDTLKTLLPPSLQKLVLSLPTCGSWSSPPSWYSPSPVSTFGRAQDPPPPSLRKLAPPLSSQYLW